MRPEAASTESDSAVPSIVCKSRRYLGLGAKHFGRGYECVLELPVLGGQRFRRALDCFRIPPVLGAKHSGIVGMATTALIRTANTKRFCRVMHPANTWGKASFLALEPKLEDMKLGRIET